MKNLFRDYGTTADEVLSVLSDAINICDRADEMETSERLADIITLLKIEWNINE